MSFRSNPFHKNRSLSAYNSLFTLKGFIWHCSSITTVFAKKKKTAHMRNTVNTKRKANLKSAVTGRHGLQIMNCH